MNTTPARRSVVRPYTFAAAALAVAAALLGAARPAAAQPGGADAIRIALLPPSGSNVSTDVLGASADVLKDHLQRTGRYLVTSIGGPPTADEPAPAQAAAQAAAAGASQAAVLRITHLGNSARVRLSVYAAAGAQLLYWDSISVSGGPEELDAVLQRLVHALVIGKPVRDAAEIDTVTSGEAGNLLRRQANKVVGVRLFSLFALNSADGTEHAVPGFGVFGLYDARSWMADLSFEYGRHDPGLIVDMAVGAYYPFLREDFTPYVGGSVKWAYTRLGGDGAGGLVLQPVFGVLLGRLSSVQMRGELGYFVDLFSENPRSAGVPGTVNYPVTGAGTTGDGSHVGHGLVLSVGIGL